MENSGSNKVRTKIIEGIDVAGEDGIHVSLRSDFKGSNEGYQTGTRFHCPRSSIDLVSKGERKFAIGMKEVNQASKLKAIQYSCTGDNSFSECYRGGDRTSIEHDRGIGSESLWNGLLH